MEQLREVDSVPPERQLVALDPQLVALVAGQLGISTAGVRSRSRLAEDLGAADADLTEILLEVEEMYGITISDAEADRIRTVADLNAVIAGKR